jgi:hypothetical protein
VLKDSGHSGLLTLLLKIGLDIGVTADVAISVPRVEAVVRALLSEFGTKDVRGGWDAHKLRASSG